MKLYKIRHKGLGLFKTKNRRFGRHYSESGDTYDTEGRARGAMLNAIGYDRTLANQLEIVEFELTEVRVLA